ncbi:hypothetical protein NUH88_15515 [Nisaea acidiphila]|uniref:Formyl transferase n=1 Tax=Nisaea acidiphila TaxID=1862145 RepID=A0A9J7AMY0_9PROT|nr:formyltransferase family protein [Nisaea acidiphila]UUX48808.1 hypothetical protein NUH88_15515 [Nisaea acidiphila]
MKKLRVGLIIDDIDQEWMISDLIKRSTLSELYSINLLIIQKSFRSEKQSPLNRLMSTFSKRGLKVTIEKSIFKLIELIEFHALKTASGILRNNRIYSIISDSQAKIPISAFDIEKIYVSPDISPNGLTYRYNDDDIEKIKICEPDVLVRGGSGILSGTILDICPFGILSFHHGDNRTFRGTPPGFWEVLQRSPSTGFVIQKLSDELDGGDVIFRGNINTAQTYTLNKARIFKKSNIFLNNILEKTAKSGRLSGSEEKTPFCYPLYKTPDTLSSFQYTFKTLGHIAAKALRKARGYSQRWSVAFQFSGSWNATVMRKATVIDNPAGHFLADPFVVERGGRHFCFVEDFDFRKGKGVISAYQLEPKAHSSLGVALEEDFHLSYPYIFSYGLDLLMCPETHEKNEIRLYRATDFPTGWQFHKTLMSGVSAADTLLFENNGKWWMLTNIDSAEIGDHDSELHIFHADSPESESWIPHSQNPVIFDSRRARNGGLIMQDDTLYRVFQVQGFDTYGESMGVARIDVLNEDEFEETVICRIEPKYLPGLSGTHHMTAAGGVTAFDFAKFESKKS